MKEKTLREILAYYGMPEKNIESAITQIAQGYGACRYLEGVAMGAEATGSSSPIARCPMENHINNVKKQKDYEQENKQHCGGDYRQVRNGLCRGRHAAGGRRDCER